MAKELSIINADERNLPRARDAQDSINHLILGITMWISTALVCITTLLTVHQPWCLVVCILPFIYTTFPQIQKIIAAASEGGYRKFKDRKENKSEAQKKEEQEEAC